MYLHKAGTIILATSILLFIANTYPEKKVFSKDYDSLIETAYKAGSLSRDDVKILSEGNLLSADAIAEIEEQGTPEEVFDAPKSEKTRAFLSKRSEGDGKAILDDDGAV